MTYDEMKQEAIKITTERASAKTPQHDAKFGKIKAPLNTVVLVNNMTFEEMKAYVEKNLNADNKKFQILVSNGLVMTVDSKNQAKPIQQCSDGGAFYIIASGRIKGGVKDIYHYSGWTKVTNQALAEEGEYIIPWWMDLHDQMTPDELQPVGLKGVVPR